MKRKRFDHRQWRRVVSGTQTVLTLPQGVLVDYRAGEVTLPLDVPCCGRTLRVLDSGFRWVYLAPSDMPHTLTVQLDAAGRPVQFYVDVNEENGVDEDGIPYGLDLFLDVLGLPGGGRPGRWRRRGCRTRTSCMRRGRRA
ncbi:DUF402 domain-containing protein [Deinococcus maricopensis]|uniref:DUF402 domain-containing protein n=1 Tax=Deinococcus maricopensis TaxID=309887 RepID=UPI001FE16692|nr:DUF402 domain-containing protein [Deinococcus maricopensis]